MINPALADLDELVLRCRDDRARSYIEEAANCYRGGAYRAAIIATWIAVCFDILDKLRELSLAGNKAAEDLLEQVERARASNDLSSALRFERKLLDVAKGEFDLISPLEFVDLSRLQQDRNRCAHPTLLSEDRAFVASAELARLHIRSAVTYLLQYPPVQGKHALERLVREVESEYFPTNLAKATASLTSGPLKRPRESLVRGFAVVLLKGVIRSDTDSRLRFRMFAALHAVRRLHPTISESTLRAKLSVLFRSVPDEGLHLALLTLTRLGDGWEYLEADVQHRLESFVTRLPSEHLHFLEDLLQDGNPLEKQATSRVGWASREELRDASLLDLPPKVGDRFIQIYLASRNYAEANEWASQMSSYASSFSPDQQAQILQGISDNSEISGSFEVGNVVSALRQTEKLAPARFDEVLRTLGLERFAFDIEDQST